MFAASTLSRRTFVASAAALAGGALATRLARAEEAPAAEQAEQSDQADQPAEDLAPEAPTPAYAVSVYAFDGVTIHAFNTCDPLGDVCYIVEGTDALVGIEMPALNATMPAWQAYVEGLGKPMNDIWVSAHPNGADVLAGVNVWGTQAAADAIAAGSTKATVDGLSATFGDAWDANYAAIDNVVADGPVTVGGIDFVVSERGDTYDLTIVAANCVYTHMLGETVHSIVPSLEAADAMVATLRGYQEAGYVLVLPAHTMPEGQAAVAAKIAYLEQLRDVAAASTSAEEFVAKMQEAFPGYDGENYLEMTAGYLFPAA